VHRNKIIRKTGVRKNDKLILTKPIGIQGIMAAYRLLKDMPEMLQEYSVKELQTSINLAIDVMTTSNQNVVRTIHSFEDFSFIHAMTDVTGFGLAGHTREMLQNSNLSAFIEKIPYLKLAKKLSNDLGYAIDDGKCHETAGGMILAVDEKYVEEFSNALNNKGISNWIIGTIDQVKPELVRISEKTEYLEITKI
jgi:selenide,water dikinase